ncbi:hypothetical protein GDO78_017267 [Eleutherodactylus coqui]|uniref:Uncharacterized protein n=1 Tax=Eleutherodactylus coqui TaxID=57060 RepID=A0A8J6BF42_ELECQ|nr:hypothetical protein GDO78_017267 [Eleutherodactylus coqui]
MMKKKIYKNNKKKKNFYIGNLSDAIDLPRSLHMPFTRCKSLVDIMGTRTNTHAHILSVEYITFHKKIYMEPKRISHTEVFIDSMEIAPSYNFNPGGIAYTR